MRSLTLVILTALLTAGLPAKAEITLEALEAGSGVPWPQALRDQVAPSLGALNEQEPHRAIAVSVNPSLDARRRLGLEGPYGGDGQPDWPCRPASKIGQVSSLKPPARY